MKDHTADMLFCCLSQDLLLLLFTQGEGNHEGNIVKRYYNNHPFCDDFNEIYTKTCAL